MRFEWNEVKRRSNLRRHGIDFEDVEEVFEGLTISVLDDRYDYGEKRFLTLGLLKTTVIAIAHTETEDTIRIISVRKALRDEEIRYFKEIKD
jgi:uncharacterized DUF497 family protein